MKKIAILGAGKSGLSAYRHYRDMGFDVYLWDENPAKVAELAEYNFINYKSWDYRNLDFIVVSPGIALEYPQKHFVLEQAEAYGVKIYVDVELFVKENPQIKYIAITGTKGKSTTTALIQHIFTEAGKKCGMAGNIGTPVFDINPSLYEYIVLELSSFQLDKMNEIHFHCALVLNITEDHTDHHGGFANYKQAKLRIFENQNFNDVAIINADMLSEIQEKIQNSKIIPIYSSPLHTDENRHPLHFAGASIIVGEHFMLDNYFTDNKNLLSYDDLIYLKGSHNYLNIAFAYAAAKFFNLPEDEIIKGVLSFHGLKHRQNNLETINNITFINDSKATNPDSTLQALKTFQNVYLILGGNGKTKNLGSEIIPFLSRAEGIFLIGKSAETFAKILQENNINFVMCFELKTATHLAFKAALKKGVGTVLLSPADASFDQFNSAEHRGDTFIKIVEELKIEKSK
ncbi:MAG: UDP-N-acetylmuramoyl-L-alanine--D-glutamate ligase [Alphaproteobacteria bacterium]|nr:UDP-N-acetylmuramoyl-L-alanine--D-glutamate ligase [Alphaproteobacteria bacterium]